MTTFSAQGVDVSLFQHPITAAQIRADGLSFAFAKATNGNGGVDPNFAANWQAIADAGVFRGSYHELTPGDGVAQARHFMTVVASRGIRPGEMLTCVASDYSVGGLEVKQFLDEVRSLAGPKCIPLLYSDLSYLPRFTSCTAYPLWIAAYRKTAPNQVAPWKTWTFWQYQAGGGTGGGDRTAFNGPAEKLDAFITAYTGEAKPTTPAKPPANWVFDKVRNLTVRAGKTSVALTWFSPGTPMPLAVDHYQVVIRHNGKDVQSYPRVDAKGHDPETWQGGSLAPGTKYTAMVRAVAAGDTHESPWAEIPFTTA